MNAALHFASALPRSSIARLVGRRGASGATLEAVLRRAFELDLAGLLNRSRRDDLERIAAAMDVDATGSVAALRARLWRHGAWLEAGGDRELGRPWQPAPDLLDGRLVHMGPVRGLSPPAAGWPRPVPPAPPALRAGIDDEPETLEDLLERATRLVGLRLGPSGRNKGAFGSEVARLLGVRERGHSEPDWRGDVELKTVPVARDRGGWWRVVEDPAVAMGGVDPERKLGRVLWIARVADHDGSPILSWYYQEWDAAVAALARACLHTRPKGAAGARTRGWYLHKRFFVGSGMVRTLNAGEAGS